MKRFIKWVIIILLVVITIKAYGRSEKNEKSFWFNFGQVSKDIVTDITDWFKPTVEDIKNGYQVEVIQE